MKQVASKTGTSETNGKTETWKTGTCRVGNGSKRHFAVETRRTLENGRVLRRVEPGYGCVTSDRQAHKANGFTPYGIVTCESCSTEGAEVLKATS